MGQEVSSKKPLPERVDQLFREEESSEIVLPPPVALGNFWGEFADYVRDRYGAEPVLYGSAAKSTWRKGSDIDIFIFSETPLPEEAHEDIYRLLWALDEKFGLQLRKAPLLHPPILWVDSPLKKGLLAKVRGVMESEPEVARKTRASLKRIALPVGMFTAIFPKIPLSSDAESGEDKPSRKKPSGGELADIVREAWQ